MTKPAKIAAALILSAAVITISRAIIIKAWATDPGPDEHTKELCRQWAAADHSGAVPRARYEWYGPENWKNFDWYGSCMAENKWLKNLNGSEK